MARAFVRILPSLQDYNTPGSAVPEYAKLYNEAASTQWLAINKLLPLFDNMDIDAQVVIPKGPDGGIWNESMDLIYGNEKLSGLRQQMKLAVESLPYAPGVTQILVNLHSDSGTFAHTFGIFGDGDGMRSAASRQLAESLADRVGRVFGHFDIRVLSKLGEIDYSKYMFWTLTSPYTSALLEGWSHQNKGDLDLVWNNPDAVAEGIFDGVMAYLGIAPAPTPAPGSMKAQMKAILRQLDAVIDQLPE